MRCKYGGTPNCKVNNWKKELETLRNIMLKSGLTEDLKWGVPCYTLNNKNIVIINAFKEYTCLAFFKGALLKDEKKILIKQGENSQSTRIIKFTNAQQITELEKTIKLYLQEAIEIEKSGKKVDAQNNHVPIPVELTDEFKKDSDFKNAFQNLNSGRQKGYIIYFSQPKNSATKLARIEKCKSDILNGIGLNDQYKKKR